MFPDVFSLRQPVIFIYRVNKGEIFVSQSVIDHVTSTDLRIVVSLRQLNHFPEIEYNRDFNIVRMCILHGVCPI